MKLFIVAVIVLLFNIPFGYWRANEKKFSLNWILSIHVPVPFIIGLRFLSGLGFAFMTYPVLVGAFFFGQFSGKRLSLKLNRESYFSVSSCLPCDLIRFFGKRSRENV